MKTIRTHGPAAALLAAVVCLAVPATVAQAQDDPLASMDVDGTNAFVDDARQPASGKDLPILDGNLVRTGKDTSALVRIIPEGSVQLNENSAKLITASFFKGARCFAVRLIAGELFINGENVCFVTNVGAVSGISHSRINMAVDGRGTVLTVIEGMAELEGQPTRMQVSASEQLVVLPNGEYYKNALDPAAAERTAEWTKDYFDAPPEKEKKKMSKGAKTALGILGVIILGKAIHEATDDDDDDRRSPPTYPDRRHPQPERSEPQTDDPAQTPTPAPPTDTQEPPPLARPPAYDIRRTAPVHQLLQPCCIGGLNGTTKQLTPAQCKAEGGDAGACTIIK